MKMPEMCYLIMELDLYDNLSPVEVCLSIENADERILELSEERESCVYYKIPVKLNLER